MKNGIPFMKKEEIIKLIKFLEIKREFAGACLSGK